MTILGFGDIAELKTEVSVIHDHTSSFKRDKFGKEMKLVIASSFSLCVCV